jgi:hypothetical protein
VEPTRKTTRKEWRLASSNLRITLDKRIPIDQFLIVEMYDSQYIYNTKVGNIIATIRKTDNKTLLRYRAPSWYSSIIEAYGKQIGAVTIASGNIGRRQRKVARNLGSSYDRKTALDKRWYRIANAHDALTGHSKRSRTLRQQQEAEAQREMAREIARGSQPTATTTLPASIAARYADLAWPGVLRDSWSVNTTASGNTITTSDLEYLTNGDN